MNSFTWMRDPTAREERKDSPAQVLASSLIDSAPARFAVPQLANHLGSGSGLGLGLGLRLLTHSNALSHLCLGQVRLCSRACRVCPPMPRT